ncbi:MAG TPA: hypothetical protein VMU43_01520 [Candidatus Acidoferrum sp.]|nr:hypothetical protein [Candidatus Acidoferrum sp.]
MTNQRSSAFRLLLVSCAAGALLLMPGPTLAQDSSQAAAQSSDSTAAKPNLAGTWNLNKDQSDDPRQKMQEAMGSSGGGGGFQGRRGGHGGGGMTEELSQLTIVQSNSSVKVNGESGRLLTQTSDYASQSQPSSQDDSNGGRHFAPPVAQWRGSQLVSVMEGRRGKSTRTYELSPDGKQLIVTTKIESERFQNPVVIRQVYDPAKAGSTPSQ